MVVYATLFSTGLIDAIFNDKELVFGVISGRVSTAINRKLYRAFKSNNIGLTPEQFMVLQFLTIKDGISQQELAKVTYRDKTSITRILDNLAKNACIARFPDKTDKRSNLIHLTKNGMELHQRAKGVVLQGMQEALKGLTTEEIKFGEVILKKIFKNIE
jgi:MarR family transcriptional regulator, organic hydroperoxide resistance regulator